VLRSVNNNVGLRRIPDRDPPSQASMVLRAHTVTNDRAAAALMPEVQ
jgi:hypothetical protein